MRTNLLASLAAVTVLVGSAPACRRDAGGAVDAAGAAEPDAAGAASPDGAAPGARDAAAPSDAGLAAGDGGAPTEDPFGVARVSTRAGCSVLAGHVTDADRTTSFVDGDDLLALVNRSPTGQLAPDYAPGDLVDLRNGKAATAADCEKLSCLRRDAAAALDELLARMKAEGFPGHVESAFRSYGAQCGTFGNWSRKSSFCEATEQSALPGHSQHQLGTTLDLFTEEWAKDPRGVFREGFGCTAAGRWLREHAFEQGFVFPYPIHPDDRHPRSTCTVRWDIPVNINPRTGYRYEHWHLRFLGKDAAARFHAAWLAHDPGQPTELTLEQWLRAEKGLGGADAELPVCDGCNCGACSTLAKESECDRKGGALHLDVHGRPVASATAPTLAGVARGKARKWHGRVVEAKVDVPAGTVTQPPIVAPDGAGYAAGVTYEKLAPYPDTAPRAFPALPEAWTLGLEPVPNDTGTPWPWRAALAVPAVGQIYDKANVLLPARPGSLTVRVPVPAVGKVKVVLLKGGVSQGEPRVVELD